MPIDFLRRWRVSILWSAQFLQMMKQTLSKITGLAKHDKEGGGEKLLQIQTHSSDSFSLLRVCELGSIRSTKRIKLEERTHQITFKGLILFRVDDNMVVLPKLEYWQTKMG